MIRRAKMPARRMYRMTNVSSSISPPSHLVIRNQRTMVTRSMSSMASNQPKQVVQVVEETGVNEEKKKEEVNALVLERSAGVMEEWPMTFSYEEDWMWKKGCEWGMGWWEVMSDLGQEPAYDNGDFWEGDIWFVKNVNQIPSPN